VSQPRFRKAHRELADFAQRIGVQGVRLEAGGKHMRLTGMCGEIRIVQIFASTPSGRRARRNMEALLKMSIAI
jgi:hypothetical protein